MKSFSTIGGLFLAIFLVSSPSWAQIDTAEAPSPKKKRSSEETIYYTDSYVRNSRFAIALNANPAFTDLRLINDDLGLGTDFDLSEDNAQGTWQLNYHADLIFELSETFDISVGLGRAFGEYRLGDVLFYQGRSDSITVDYRADVSMTTIPIKINFNSSISEVFDLEVVPSVELNFIDNYNSLFIPEDPASESFERDYSEFIQEFNYSVGIHVGGTFWIADRWGLFVRGGIKYMLNQIITRDNFPRETLLNVGANTGVRFNF